MRVSLPMIALALVPFGGLVVMVLLPPPETKRPPEAPIHWVDDRGALVSLEAPPQRVVSLAPSLTEMIFALGAGDRLAGRTRFAVAPAAAFPVPVVGGMADVNLETLASMRPDLVIATDLTPPEVADRLAALGIPLATFRHETIDDVLADMEALATLLGMDAEGQHEAERLRKLRNLAAEEAGPDRPRVLVLLGTADLYSPGPSTYAYEVVDAAGADQATGDMTTAWPLLSMERVLAFDPEVIVVASSGNDDDRASIRNAWTKMKADGRWQNVSAVRNDRLVIIADSLLTIPGPRVAEAIQRVARGIRHPDDAHLTPIPSKTP